MSARGRILPNNGTPIERALEGVAGEVLGVPVEFHKLWNPDECPASHLHILARTYAVETWRSDWPEATKRAVIKATPEIKRHKGTRLALESALNALDKGTVLSEWFEYGGRPYCFRIDIDWRGNPAPWSQSDWKVVFTTAIAAKNVRSFIDVVNVKRRAEPATVFLAAYPRTKATTRIEPPVLTSITPTRPYVWMAGAMKLSPLTRVYPE